MKLMSFEDVLSSNVTGIFIFPKPNLIIFDGE